MNNSATTYFCPGRVNLIGEHIDYNGGLVMPAAISMGITAHIVRNGSEVMRIRSGDSKEMFELHLQALVPRHGHWTDHVIGVMLALKQRGLQMEGCDIAFTSTLPQGSGLSSSAAMEVLTYYMLTHFLTGQEPDRKAMAMACQQVENAHIGVHCGIMDQFAVAMGRRDRALLLDCSTLKHEEIPMDLGNHSLLIMDSTAPRQLAPSGYNTRRAECDAALS
ncbi:MAG: galactokinase, partial [Flavobacteriales bacterium]|nr:galactokinase [Flavobacteriales bacterium]